MIYMHIYHKAHVMVIAYPRAQHATYHQHSGLLLSAVQPEHLHLSSPPPPTLTRHPALLHRAEFLGSDGARGRDTRGHTEGHEEYQGE